MGKSTSSEMQNAIRAHIGNSYQHYRMWGVAPENSIEGVIRKIFKEHYPVTARRHELFKARQAPGQDWGQFKQFMVELASGAELRGITEDKLLCFILMNNTHDKKLLEEFLKIEDGMLSSETLSITATAYTRRHTTLDSMDGGSVNAASTYKKNIQMQQRRNAPRKPNGQRGVPERRFNNTYVRGTPTPQGRRNTFFDPEQLPQHLRNKCLRCGNPSHTRKDCTVEKKKLQCNHCKTEGMHNTSCCIHKANAEKTRPGTVATVEEEMECNAIRGESDDEGNNMETDEVDQSIAPETSSPEKKRRT